MGSTDEQEGGLFLLRVSNIMDESGRVVKELQGQLAFVVKELIFRVMITAFFPVIVTRVSLIHSLSCHFIQVAESGRVSDR